LARPGIRSARELASFRLRLQIQALVMLGLVGAAFVTALSVSLQARP
jgi:hypothetical protein